ncbi:triggering receptor expressed on myeloid cells 1-like isoform X2 [Peromyscus leucopus]|uniref:triggering receptor expressed on myeloid cells 1-like isoform X2 n=1 Tax=Peromyscus leucopus TaxID=10041 RepID=UPI001884F261|nr:triggering receptor expressed on myeloid cells 1-like isoform X2 [Peromyscus leucopus]
MAWEATCLLSPILLVLLASGSWAHDTVLHHTVEGKTVLVRCQYDPSQRFKEKVWCQETPEKTCKVLVSTNTTDAQQSKFSLQDYPDYQFFTVTMTALTVRDSGPYFCGIAENLTTISVLRNIYLKVSKDSSGLPTLSITPTTSPTKAPILITTKHLPRDRTVTQAFPKSTARVSPDPGVTFPNVTTVTRVSISSIVVLVVCGLFIKTLVFTVLFAVTRRSFG